MNTRNFILASVVALGLSACDSDTTKTDTKKVVTKTEVKADAKKPDVKPMADAPKPDAPKDEVKDPAAAVADGKVQLAATVAREISGAPDKADEILGKHNLDRDKLDALMFEIAGDPKLTEAYMAARRET